ALGCTSTNGKSKTFRGNATNPSLILLEGSGLQGEDSFNNYSSLVDLKEGTDDDVRIIIGKARADIPEFNIWRAEHNIKKIYNQNFD
ncbi:hypothetical protein ElyMa_000751800, partial [Elysia marginata]